MGPLTAEKKIAYDLLNEQLEESVRKLFEKVDYVAKVRNSLDLHDSGDVEDKEEEILEVQSSPASQKDSALSVNTLDREEINVNNDQRLQGVICNLNAKIEKMQQAYDNLTEKYRQKDEEVSNHLRENFKLLDEKEQWMLISLGDQAKVNDLEEKVTTLRSKLENKEEEVSQLKKQIAKLQTDVKNIKGEFFDMTLLHGNTIKEYERVLAALKAAKHGEKTLRQSHDKQICELEAAMQTIKKQRNKLTSTLKKQLKELDASKCHKMISK